MKKALSVLLAVVMLFSVMSVCAGAAEPTTYTGYANIMIDKTNTFDPENFEILLDINPDKLGALDGHSTDFTFEMQSVRTPTGVDYLVNPEDFLAVFTDEEFNGSSIIIDFTVDFESTAIFGELDYTITIKGFKAPIDLGIDLGGLGGLLGGDDGEIDTSANIPTDVVHTGTIEGVPTIKTSTINILSIPEKTDYYDSEKFDPNGLKLEFTLSNGEVGTFTYNEETANMFSFSPSAKEKLSCYDSEVATFIGSVYVMSTPITVNHKWSDGFVNITTYKYTDANPGYHAIVCEGCGETHSAEKHVPGEEWVYNNDQTFVDNGTASNTCTLCGTELVQDVLGTADFNTTFNDFHFLKVIFEYINVLLRFIGATTE